MFLKFSKNAGKALVVSAVLLSPVATMAAPTLYAQAQGGLSSYNIGEDSSRFEFKGNFYTWRVSGGALWNTCTPWQYGLEAGFADYPRLARGSDDYTFLDGHVHENWKLSGYSIDVLGVAKYNFNCRFNAFGKAGFAYLNENLDSVGRFDDGSIAYKANGTAHTVAPEVALGVGYRFTRNLEGNVGVNAIFAGSSDFSNVMTTVAGLTAGLTYYFA